MPRTRVKICGITRVSDAIAAAEAGADAIGMVFYAGSPRHVGLDRAKQIAVEVGPFVTRVGLFVNASPSLIEEVLAQNVVDILQFHGDEQADDCSGHGAPYIKALRMHQRIDLEAEIAAFPDARGILLDAWSDSTYGGTGEQFDWWRAPSRCNKPIILAGGLTPSNVRKAVETVMPYAVDVSSGVEQSPGIKSPDLIREFIKNANLGVNGD